ncbi:M13 family metallopeptidase [Pelomonas sp. KK5]|uniref:M13 family metallopeptidase n=1 Tax=Pelomonas sp. KK5 TaxID=1855730 RepID=UPI00097BAFBA|nr:M13 family metallopeptidase [Pelomonas sp. KK5]
MKLTPLILALTVLTAQAAPLSAGVDTAAFDKAVRPQDDLFKAVNGRWLKATKIPADRSETGAFTLLEDLSDQRVRTIVEGLAKKPQAEGSDERRIADFYKSYTDLKAIDKAGLAPVRGLLEAIDAIDSPFSLAVWLGRAQGRFNVPLQMQVLGDAKDPAHYAALTWQAGLGMPDRDYYLKPDDPQLGKTRAAYQAYLRKLAALAGDNPATADQALALEDRIAQSHWPKAEMRDPVKIYNPMTRAELAEKAPGLDWPAFLQAAQLTQVERLIVSQPSQVAAAAKLVAEVPLTQWKAYLRLRVLDESADLLPKPFRDAAFGFHGTAISGAKQERPRWQKGVAEVNGALGEAVGRVYVTRYFPPAAKARMQELVANLLVTYKVSIDGLSWMSPETKAEAQAKLAKYTTKIGYPDKWRDYAALQVKAGDPIGNRLRAGRFEWERQARRVGGPVDRAEWGMTPQTVNAYYEPTLNEIVFPAAILQKPFFDMAADDAANYGAIGAIIGHEISHGFDDEGSQYDGDGALRNWWTESDRKAFEAIADRLAAQYDGYEPIPGHHVNGRLTLGENIADLSGLQIAYKAWQRSLGGKPAPVIGGMSGEQRFFYGWAQAWREKTRDERLLQLVTSNPHSPPQYRADGAAINHDGFHEAFGTKAGDRMFKPAGERIRIW